MSCHPVFIIFYLALVGTLDAKAINTQHVSSGQITLYDTNTGSHRRLVPRDIAFLGKNVTNLSIYLDDLETSPLDLLVTKTSVWNSDSIVTVQKGPRGRTQQVTHNTGSDCFLHGRVVDTEGTAVIKRCGKLTMTIQFPTHQYDVEEDGTFPGDSAMTFKVTRQERDMDEIQAELELSKGEINLVDMGDHWNQDDYINYGDYNLSNTGRHKRETTSITIEVALTLDSEYADDLYFDKNLDTTDKIIDYMVSKWTTIQGVLSDVETVGTEVKIEVKHLGIWWQNPEEYPANVTDLHPRLGWFCRNTPETDSYDLKVLYFKNTATIHPVLSYMNGMCRDQQRCSAVKSSTPRVLSELHGLGHTLGFKHDSAMAGCGDEQGFMGSPPTYTYLPCYKRTLMRNLRSSSMSCLYHTNVAAPNILAHPTHRSQSSNNNTATITTTTTMMTTTTQVDQQSAHAPEDTTVAPETPSSTRSSNSTNVNNNNTRRKAIQNAWRRPQHKPRNPYSSMIY